jgi:acetyl-CoA carboxylase alpha subunit
MERLMWRHDEKAVMVIAEGRCKVVGEAKWNEFGYVLPEGMRVLLCLIDGAERRQDLLRRWSGEAVPSTGKR